MKVTARGWNRNMGDNIIVDNDLSDLAVSRDPSRYILFDRQPAVFRSSHNISIDWGKKLNYSGNYRMEVELSCSDILALFRTMFGSELDVDLVEEHGFTVSPELQKRILGTIKLADLTIGDLATLGSPTTKETPAEPAKPLIRRV